IRAKLPTLGDGDPVAFGGLLDLGRPLGHRHQRWRPLHLRDSLRLPYGSRAVRPYSWGGLKRCIAPRRLSRGAASLSHGVSLALIGLSIAKCAVRGRWTHIALGTSALDKPTIQCFT